MKWHWLLIVLVAVVVYSVCINNFFTFDDFIWLNRARTIRHDFWQIFRQDVTYFDPLVHLMFAFNAALAGLDPRWYHVVDLALHAVNALLVYRLARLLGGGERAPLYAGILFAGSFAAADAVLWSSSRVDLVSTVFALASLIQFLHYLHSDKQQKLWLSLAMFVLALCAKGTPLVLPVVLGLLVAQGKKPLRRANCLIPFAAIVLLYLVLLKLTAHNAALPLDRLHFNLRNLALALNTLFISENTVKYLNASLLAVLLFALLSVAGFAASSRSASAALRRTGYFLMILAIVPVLVVTDFKLLGEFSDPYLVLSSPSHRIYLASAGAALLCGGLLGSLEALLQRWLGKGALVAVSVALAVVVCADAALVRQRDQVWQLVGERTRAACQGLRPYRGRVPAGSQLGLIYFPGSGGFQLPLAEVCLEVDDLTVIKEVTLGPIRDPEILRKAEKSYLFVLTRDGRVQDKSELFRQQLLLNREAILHPEHPEYLSQCESVAGRLNREIE